MATLTTPGVTPPDVVRCAYAELIVTDLAASRAFYVDVLGLTVTKETADAVYLRPLEEFIHHNLVLRKGPVAACAALAFRGAAVKQPLEGGPSGDMADLAADWRSRITHDLQELADQLTSINPEEVRQIAQELGNGQQLEMHDRTSGQENGGTRAGT